MIVFIHKIADAASEGLHKDTVSYYESICCSFKWSFVNVSISLKKAFNREAPTL